MKPSRAKGAGWVPVSAALPLHSGEQSTSSHPGWCGHRGQTDLTEPSGGVSPPRAPWLVTWVQNFLLWTQILPHRGQQDLVLLPPGHSEALGGYFSFSAPLHFPLQL